MSDNTKESKASILVVEDEILIAADLESLLNRLGYTVCGKAATGEKALELVERHRPDLILMDIVLQGDKDGIGAAEIIRAEWGIPIVFLTAYADTVTLERAKITYPFGYLLKPFQEEELIITIEMALYVSKVDEKRRKAEKELELTLETVTEGIWSWNFKTRELHFSSKCYTMLGYEPYEFQVSYENWTHRIHPDDRDALLRSATEYLKTKSDYYEIEFRHKTGSGDYCWIRAAAGVAERDRKGEAVRIIGNLQDITERKLAENTLRESEKKYRTLFENMEQGAFYQRADGAVTDANQATLRMFGLTRDQFLGKTSLDPHWRVIREDGSDFPGDRHPSMVALKTGKPVKNVVAGVYNTQIGDFVWININAAPQFKPGENLPYQVFVTIHDITDRKRIEEKLKKSEEQYRNVVGSMSDTLSVIDGEGNFLFANRKAADNLSGRPPEEVIGKNIKDFVPLKQAQEFIKNYQNTIITERPFVEEVKATMMGVDRWFLNRLSPIQYGHDGGAAVLSMSLEITGFRQAEAEKETLQTQLQQAQKMEAIGRLAGGISHDFNNLLQIINGYTQILLFDIDVNNPAYPSLTAIHKAVKRAAELVRQLLLFSRKADTERNPVDLNREVEQVKRILERTIPKMVDIEVRLGGRLWAVKADPVQMEQVILNLGGNAADAMPDGGELRIETKNVILDEAYARKELGAPGGKYVLLTISDTGHGMDSKTLEHIFEPFFTTKEIGKGTGLGLASAYGIVKSHGGEIVCRSEVGRGTTFRIYLPAMDLTEIDVPEDISTVAPEVGTETVLVVDDEKPIRDFASKALEKFGYTVLAASSGEEALDIYLNETNEIDIVLLDIGMPGMGGFKCCREIMERDPSAKVLVASGYAIDGDVKKTLESGAAGYVGKPYQVFDLLKKVRDVLDGGK